MSRLQITLLAAALLAAACGGKPKAKIPAPAPARVGAFERGVASWYGEPYHGRRTSNGEIYDMHKLTAAHQSLPFGTRVRVTNRNNSRSVEVRINDRGPFVDNRVIDLSYEAARRVRMIGTGTAPVLIEILAAPGGRLDPSRTARAAADSGCPAGPYFAVQAGSFRTLDNAERMRAKMSRRYGAAFVHLSEARGSTVYRVFVGRLERRSDAESLLPRLAADGVAGFVKRVDAAEAAACVEQEAARP